MKKWELYCILYYRGKRGLYTVGEKKGGGYNVF